MSKEMLINVVRGQECRIAIVSDGRLEELYMERASSASHVGNIYKGRITNVEPSIQAAFVDFGGIKNGFLHISDVHPQYFPKAQKSSGGEAVGRKRPHRDRPPIQECLRRGQEVVVQMTKEGIGTKGPTLTTYLSIPGRLLVMMPGMSKLGVSRKIEDDEARDKAREILNQLKLPSEMGFIIRTAGIDRPKRDLQRDLNYLLRLWKSTKQQIKQLRAPAVLYQESDLVTRTLRDVYNTDIERILCDNAEVALKVKEFLDVAMPRSKHAIELYTGKQGLFHDAGLDNEIERIYSRRVELPSGGSLVIDQTEALVAIDVNSGRFREHSDAETTALKMNLEAAREIARQLRLRDMGGVIIIDFIDMREEKNRRSVERALREAIKPDRAKTKLQRISAFGIVEMTRQRMRPSLKDSIYRRCPHCDGMGLIKSEESQALGAMRMLQRVTSIEDVVRVEVHVTPPAAHHMSNYQRQQIAQIELETGKMILVCADETLVGDQMKLVCLNNRGAEVAWDRGPFAEPARSKLQTIPVEQVPGADKLPQPMEGDEFEEEAELAEGGEEAPPPVPVPVPVHKGRHPAGPKPGVPQPPKPPTPAPLPPSPAPTGEGEAPTVAGGEDEAGDQPTKKRRRGRRGGRKHRKRNGEPQASQQPTLPGIQGQGDVPVAQPATSHHPQPRAPEARERTTMQPSESPSVPSAPPPAREPQAAEAPPAAQPAASASTPAEGAPAPAPVKKSRRRRRPGGRKASGDKIDTDEIPDPFGEF